MGPAAANSAAMLLLILAPSMLVMEAQAVHDQRDGLAGRQAARNLDLLGTRDPDGQVEERQADHAHANLGAEEEGARGLDGDPDPRAPGLAHGVLEAARPCRPRVGASGCRAR